MLFIFYCNNLTSFEGVFCVKTVKSRLFKKYLKISAKSKWKKIMENYNSVGVGAHTVGKLVRFWPNFEPNFPIWKVWNR